MIEDYKNWEHNLKSIIKQNSFNYSPEASFKLVCGGTSRFYFDCKRTTLRADGQFYIGNMIYELIKDDNVQAIGGLTLGADAIATSVAYTSNMHCNPIHAMIVRKVVKDHGMKKRIEGMIYPPKKTNVVVVDDVITTGRSIIEAIEVFKEAGYTVEKAVVLIDRGEMNARDNVLKYVPEMISIFKAEDFLKF